jgi:hypothetical protein
MKAVLKLYSPHASQLAFHSSNARYRVASWGRQSGKSTACLNELARRAWENPNHTYWFISPTFDQARGQYRRFVNMLMSCPEIMLKKNQTELRVKLINQSEVVFKSGEVGENLRGATLHGVVIDEVRDQPKDLWPMLIRPMLTTTKGWAAFVSTPNGYDYFFDLAEKSKTDPEWELFTSPSTCNPLFTQSEFEAAKKEMSEAFFAQEILAEFRDLHSGSAYINFGDHNLAIKSPFTKDGLYSPYLPIVVALDFNLAPSIALFGQERAGQFYWFDEIYLDRSHTQEVALEIVARLKALELKGNPKVIIIGDATGKAGQRAAMGRSDYSIIEEIFTNSHIQFENRTPDSNPEVKDRVNVVNSKLKAADGIPHIWLNPEKCPQLKKDLQRVSWKRGLSARPMLDQTTDPTLTHISDAMGYAICGLSKLWAPSVGGLRMIRRN